MILRTVITLAVTVALAASIGEARVVGVNNVGNISALNQPPPVLGNNARHLLDPEIEMTATEIIMHWGYPAEEIYATTEDGYILTMHRIPWGKSGPTKDRPVIFLQHGLEDCSTSWVINRPEQSAGFMFADAGYDVYLGNMRGNVYSRDHITLDPKSRAFWKFSFDEMVKYDLDAQIDMALKTSNVSSLYYAGHSQGTLTMFSKLSRDADFHKKIRKFFALAPVATVKHIRGMLHILAEFLYDEVKLAYALFGDGEFLPTGDLLDLVAKYVCETTPGAVVCDSFIAMLMGVDQNQLNSTRMPVYVAHIPSGTSTQNVMHWIQMTRSGILRSYDFGRRLNRQKYRQDLPPIYDVANDNAEIYLYWSPKDWLADEKDIEEYLLPTLRQQYIVKNIKLEAFNHVDFLWGMRAADEIYKPIIEVINADVLKRQELKQQLYVVQH